MPALFWLKSTANEPVTAIDSGDRPAVLVTRPAGEAADRLAQRVGEAGYRVVQQPLLQLAPVPELSPDQRQLLLDLDQYQHVIFISTNAVRFAMDYIEDYWPQLPVGPRWYAIGEATASLLHSHGVQAATPGAAMTSEGLLALPGLSAVEGTRVLIVRGEGGRRTLATQLAGRGARVDELACYRRSPCPIDPEEFAARLTQLSVRAVLISSGEGLQHLVELLSPAESSNVKMLCLIVPSERVARLAEDAGFIHVETAENASDAAMLCTLEQWTARSGE